MRIKIALIGSLILILMQSGIAQNKRPVDYVDPYLGAVSCRWFFSTPAAVPFGMARLSPHTNAHYGNKDGWEAIGFDNRDESIEGFGHFHEFQVGGLVLMPTTGKLKTTPGSLVCPESGYRSRFDKNSVIAKPGYYSVVLKDYDIKVEMTATQRVGFHRYTFPKTDQAHVLIDPARHQGESGKILDSKTTLLDNNYEVEGYYSTYPEYVKKWMPEGKINMYYVMRFNRPAKLSHTFTGDVAYEMLRETGGKESGLVLTFDTKENQIIEVAVGLSYTSIENARKNLDAEAKGQSFDQVEETAINTWNDYLSRIKVEGGKESDKVKFYTGLWHALSGRGLASDVNGAYPRYDGKIGQIPLDKNGKPKYAHYNSDATWGAFWNLMSVWSIAYPEYLSSYVQAHLDYARDCGWLPDGVAAGRFVPGVPSNFLGLMISAAYARQIRDFDVETAYQAARKNELEWKNRLFGVGKYDLKDFIEKGYIPHDVEVQGWKFGASHTLEYAFSSWAVGQMAKSLGKKEDFQLLNAMGYNYKNIFDPSVKFMRAKNRDGSFIKDFTPSQVWNGFQEGNAWQYTWYVPQDVAGLANLLGKDVFVNRLDSVFTESVKKEFGGGKSLDAFSGLTSIYNQGNQPNLHISWLFNYVGKPWLSQKWVREICDVFYGTTPEHGYGYGQDEDQGQLGSWYVLAAMGIFDVQGGAAEKPTFQMVTPLFDKITISLNTKYGKSKQFEIITKRNNDSNRFIQSAKLNGKTLNKPWFYQSDLFNGSKLEIEAIDKPNTKWGSNLKDAPPSMSTVK